MPEPDRPFLTTDLFRSVLHRCGRVPALVYVALWTYCHKHRGTVWPSIARLASDLKCQRRAVQLALRSLERAGFLESMPQQGQTTVYTLPMVCPDDTDLEDEDEYPVGGLGNGRLRANAP